MVGYNETCIEDRQCQALDTNSHCLPSDEMSKRARNSTHLMEFKYPHSLSPKVIVSKYFNTNDSEDEIYLKPKEYIKKW
ncbi:unnamed protein product [Medioppia subpectinata]|uniref:Uncharacterized protein n=1 Tax=Medioppia subpectinata TaxID=1979941 RepID=A0A7R9Q1N2_9ACAR|nr:unnamed protein product [Medioppia subpectinata]CAG2109414.1 unnamed protein product [Medioppia subpectinata]